MKKYLTPILITLFLGLSLIFLTILMNYSSSNSTAEATIRKLNLNINPKFKSEIYNYYTFDCDKNSFRDLDNRNDLSGLTISFPYIDVSARKNLVQNKTYTITCLPTAIPTYKVVNPEPNDDYFLLTDSLLLNNSLSSTYDSAIVLRDSQGTPIWWLSTKSSAIANEKYNFVSDPKFINNNSQVLFYASRDVLRGYSDGEYFVYDLKESKIVKKYFGSRDDKGNGTLDQHDLIIKSDGTGIGMRYKVRNDLDLTEIGINLGTPIVDGQIVLLNSDGTENKVISMMELIDPKEIDLGILKYYGVNAPPYDFVHLNSIELDGNSVIVSSRNIDAVHKIDLETGEVVWRIGGNSSTKKDLKIESESGLNKTVNNFGKFTNIISSQHDARLYPSRVLSIFDNGTYANRNPRIIELKLDEKNSKAKVISSYASTFQDQSNCCGSARKLSDDKWLVSWGGDFRFGLDVPSVISTINNNNVETNILMNPLGVINYRAIPYELTDKEIELFREDMVTRQ
jgi:hypothetical protein